MTSYAISPDRDRLDRYYTPSWATQLLLERLRRLDAWTHDAVVAEPCYGQGHLGDVFESEGHEVIGGDIDPEAPCPQVDATADEALDRYGDADWVVTNPPYAADSGSCTEVVRSLLRLELPMVVLTRITWLEPCEKNDSRGELFEGTLLADPGEDIPGAPDEIIVLPRVDFEGPAAGSDNPATSVWVLWLGLAGPCSIRWATGRDRERVEGQASLM